MTYPKLVLSLPDWVDRLLAAWPAMLPRVEDRMRLAIALSRASMEHGGGPFGAAVFDLGTFRLVAPGVNLVMASRCSVAHAEVIAIGIAQQILGHFDLGARALPPLELVSSTEPCLQCFGVVVSSGLRRLACGARTEDAEAIGFDEGGKPADWPDQLAGRGLTVAREVLRAEAAEVLAEYRRRGLPIYHVGRTGG